MRSLLLLAILLPACFGRGEKTDPQSPTGTPISSTPGATGGGERPEIVEIKERRSAEAYYEDGAAGKPKGLARDAFEVIARYYATINAPPPRFDERLSLAAQTYAQHVPASGALPRRFVDHYLAKQGIAEPYPKVVSFAFPPDASAEFLEKLGGAMSRIVTDAATAELRIGIGIAEHADDGKIHIVLAMLPGRLSLEPVAQQLSPGKTVKIRGGLQGPYRTPRLVITSPDGSTVTVRGEGEARAFSLETRLESGKGRYEIEIVADGTTGPEVCGLFSVYAGVDLPEAPAIAEGGVKEPIAPEAAEKIIFELVNAERKKAGLAPLLPLEGARKIARAYSEEMRTTGKVGHISSISGKPEDRLKKGGVKSPLVLENVARSYSPEDAHAGLMDSPGHRANVLNPKITHLGIGVAVDVQPNSPPAYYVTQSFVRIGGEDPKTVVKELPVTLAKARAAAGLPDLVEDPKLSELAKAYIKKLESGELDKDSVAKAIFDELARSFGSSYQVAAPLVTVLPYLDPLAKAKGLGDPQFTHYGAAIVVTSKKSPLGEGQIALILVLGGKR